MSQDTNDGAVLTAPSTLSLKQDADSITNRRTIYAAGAGLIPFPLIDVAALLGVQVIMIRDIAGVYNVDFKEQRTRSLITTLVGDLAAVGVMSGVKVIPVVGSIVGAFSTSITGAAATYALGKVFTQHFDQGGTLLNFDPVKSRKYFQDSYEDGKLFVDDLSDTDEEVKKKGFLSNIFKKKEASVELDELKKNNQEMKETIAQLQKSVDALALKSE